MHPPFSADCFFFLLIFCHVWLPLPPALFSSFWIVLFLLPFLLSSRLHRMQEASYEGWSRVMCCCQPINKQSTASYIVDLSSILFFFFIPMLSPIYFYFFAKYCCLCDRRGPSAKLLQVWRVKPLLASVRPFARPDISHFLIHKICRSTFLNDLRILRLWHRQMVGQEANLFCFPYPTEFFTILLSKLGKVRSG